MSLPGIGDACYDLRVSNGTDTVWSLGNPLVTALGANQLLNNGPTDVLGTPDLATVCAGQYGNGAGGDITYIGTCDATVDSNTTITGTQNLVTIWIDGLYNTANTADVGEWRDPCGAGGCTLAVDCVENADSRASFDFAIMREANQGFFDIAVNFEDVFCSAKFDTCYDDGDDVDTLPDHITLLHGGDTIRDWTGVFGFACTAGADTLTSDVQTNLLYGAVTVTCGTDVFTLDPTLDEGNQVATAGGKSLHYGVYRVNEQLDCALDQSCNKLSWNIAVSIDDLVAQFPGVTCSIALQATADDITPGGGHIDFVDGEPTGAGVSYPYVNLAANLTNAGVGFCQQNELNGGGAVGTVYAGNVGVLPSPTIMCSQFDGSATGPTGGCP